MTILNADGSIADAYRNYIALSRYARWLPEENRRETWTETVDRYIEFMKTHLADTYRYDVEPGLMNTIRDAIAEHKVLPSMRALMTAGPALERSNIAAFNCSYTPIDDIDTLWEILYILMNGTGVGYSVEKQYVDNLPPIAEHTGAVGSTIIVGDSKEGWAYAYRALLYDLWIDGVLPAWDLSCIREAGARLETFGGRASGPEPLHELFSYTVDLLKGARGRKLRPIEVHDLVCKIASVVVVGGVRRSAMIALSDLDDREMALAKSGSWWESAPHRALANISAVYHDGVTREQFDLEWETLKESGSGERGIFNRSAAQRQAAKYGHRDPDIQYGTNPCSEIILKPRSFCNLSTVTVEPTDTLDDLTQKIVYATILGTWQSTFTDYPVIRKEWSDNAREERLLGVSLNGIFGNPLLYGPGRRKVMEQLRNAARAANAAFAAILGIPPSDAITCVKPEGTSSQLVQCSSGAHAWHSEYYIRAIRADSKDPLARLLIDAGVPYEQDLASPTNFVFYFPIAAPEGAVCREHLSAVEHLEVWLDLQRYWCEHKPSVTVSIRGPKIVDPGPMSSELAYKMVTDSMSRDDLLELLELLNAHLEIFLHYDPAGTDDPLDYLRSLITYDPGEWDQVKEWVWEHLDEMSGVSFLPFSEHTYKQAPYTECSKEAYEAAVVAFPSVRWADLPFYELTDSTEAMQTLACTAAGCEV